MISVLVQARQNRCLSLTDPGREQTVWSFLIYKWYPIDRDWQCILLYFSICWLLQSERGMYRVFYSIVSMGLFVSAALLQLTKSEIQYYVDSQQRGGGNSNRVGVGRCITPQGLGRSSPSTHGTDWVVASVKSRLIFYDFKCNVSLLYGIHSQKKVYISFVIQQYSVR